MSVKILCVEFVNKPIMGRQLPVNKSISQINGLEVPLDIELEIAQIVKCLLKKVMDVQKLLAQHAITNFVGFVGLLEKVYFMLCKDQEKEQEIFVFF